MLRAHLFIVSQLLLLIWGCQMGPPYTNTLRHVVLYVVVKSSFARPHDAPAQDLTLFRLYLALSTFIDIDEWKRNYYQSY